MPTAIRPTVGRVVAVYRAVYVACIVALSALAIAHGAGRHPHVVPIAAAEIVAALLLLFRRTRGPGLAGLLVVFAAAAAITVVTAHEPPIALALYAASAVLIVRLDGADA